jgi:hypothetical protein
MSVLRLPLLLLTLAAVPSQAGTLKALFVICDAYETDSNNAIAESVRVDLATMTRLTHALEQANVMPVQRVVLQGSKASSANIWKAIAKLDVGPDDTLLFYFSGHGANDHEHSLLYAVDEEELDRARLEKELLAKKARLTVLLTDACNSYLDGDSRSRSFLGAEKRPEDFSAQWKALFATQRGLVHISAASPGEYAWSDNDEGGSFTHALVNEGLLKHPGATWDEVFAQAKQKTMASFNAFPRQQRAKLREEGITSQTPKAYRLPGAQDAAPPTTTTTTPPKPVKPTPSPNPAPAAGKVVLTNKASSPTLFLHDLNTDESNWSEDRVRSYTLGRNKSQSLPAPARVGWLNGDDSVVKELEAGAYHFETGDDGLVLVQEGAAPPPPPPGNDGNKDNGNKDDRRAQKLEQTRARLVGTWLWEDSDGQVTSVLGGDGTFKDKSERGRTVEQGTWTLVAEKSSKGKNRTYLAFTSKDKQGVVNEYRYRFKFTDDDTVSLVLRRTLRDGERVDDDENGMDGTVTMYRQ